MSTKNQKPRVTVTTTDTRTTPPTVRDHGEMPAPVTPCQKDAARPQEDGRVQHAQEFTDKQMKQNAADLERVYKHVDAIEAICKKNTALTAGAFANSVTLFDKDNGHQITGKSWLLGHENDQLVRSGMQQLVNSVVRAHNMNQLRELGIDVETFGKGAELLLQALQGNASPVTTEDEAPKEAKPATASKRKAPSKRATRGVAK